MKRILVPIAVLVIFTVSGCEESTGPDTIRPTAPTGLIAEADDARVILSWDPNSEGDLSHYIVYQSTASGFAPTSSDSVKRVNKPVTTVTLTGLVNDTTYYYRLAAVDDAGNRSEYSGEASAVPISPLDTTPPAAPTGLIAEAGDAQVILSWDPNSEDDLSHYIVYQSTASGLTPTANDSVSSVNKPDTTVTLTGLVNDTTYYYRIAAVDDAGNRSGYSGEASATPFSPNVAISGNGAYTEYRNFEFMVFDFLGPTFLFIAGYSQSDTLLILFIDTTQIQQDTPIALTDTIRLLIAGTFGSYQYVTANFGSAASYVSGSLTFTVVDTAGMIAGTFASGSSLGAIAAATTTTTFKAAISGSFEAAKGTDIIWFLNPGVPGVPRMRLPRMFRD